jgi:sigma-B regulation protein RsbU (phosphoserine phosphatase)
MLPSIFPPFPDRDEFDIYASMQPAKEVGGDFYDFFFVGEHTLAVVMADVSGKGVPAALFMAIAKTLIKNTALSGKSPEVVFGIVNKMLCEGNEVGMFVTAFLGYLDIRTGRFTFVNAGHNPPLLCSGGRFDWLKTKPGFILAGMEDTFYKQHEVILKPGDELFLYTDGLAEIKDTEKTMFGQDRNNNALRSFEGGDHHQMLNSMLDKAYFYSGISHESMQMDDITMSFIELK